MPAVYFSAGVGAPLDGWLISTVLSPRLAAAVLVDPAVATQSPRCQPQRIWNAEQ